MMLLIEGLTAGASCLIEPDVCSAHCYNFAKHFLASVCSHLEVLSSLCWGTHTGSSVPLSSWHTFTKLSSRVSPPAIGRVPLGDLSVNSSGWISAYVYILVQLFRQSMPRSGEWRTLSYAGKTQRKSDRF